LTYSRPCGRTRRRLAGKEFRVVALVMALALAVVGLAPSAQAQSADSASMTACELSNWQEAEAANDRQRPGAAGKASFHMGCAADAPERFAERAAAPDDFLMTFEIDETDEIDQKQLENEVEKVRKSQAAGQTLSDIFKSRASTYKLGVYAVPGDGVEFDGTIDVVDGSLVLVLPADEIVPQANWWQKVIAFWAAFAAGTLSTVICFGFFAVGAPLALPVCGAVGGFVGGMVNELLNAVFDEREINGDVWAEAFAVAISSAVAGAATGGLMHWAELNANPLMQQIAQGVKDLASKLATEFSAAVDYAAGVARKIGGQLYAKLLEVVGKAGIKGAPTTLRVMPLGDSITSGVGSSTGSSYRADLWNSLSGNRHTVDFVGSQRSGQLPDTDHEGVSGNLISQIADRSRTAVGMYRPNVVTIHAGTNDMDRTVDPTGAPARLGAMIDQILADSPGVTVLVATLVPSRDAAVQKRIDAFNQKVVDLAEQRFRAGKKVRAVSMSSLTNADLVDRLHPNDSGYRKMADVFHHAIDQSILSGMVKNAGPGPGPVCNDAPNRWLSRGQIASGVGAPLTEIAFADIDGDRRDDYLVVNRSTGAVRAWLNRGGDSGGSAGWAPRGQIAAGVPLTAAERTTFADIDGDGRDDYLVLNASTGVVRAWLNRGGDSGGTPGWTPRGQIAAGVPLTGDDWITFADIDGDGRDDYLKVNSMTGVAYAWLNRGGDSGGSAGWAPRGQIAAGVPLSRTDTITFSQINCDRLSDYLVVNRSTGAVRAWLNRGADSGGRPGWTARGQIAAGAHSGAVVFADMDGDGRDDYLVLDDNGAVHAWLNRGGDPA
jgi:lysophospholipase L1-like esterase